MTKVSSDGWKEFEIGEYFDVVKGKRLTKANMKPGNVRFIGSSAFKNGTTAYISNEENRHKGNLITVCYNGSVGETFYQEDEFIASDDVNVLYPKFAMNKYIALFLCPIIRSKGKNYEFVDKWTKDKMEKTKIPLPVDGDNKPDWLYMEEYMKSIESNVNKALSRLVIVSKSKKTKLDVKDWKSFDIIDYFELSLPKGDIQVKGLQDGSTPLITPSNINNGLIKRIPETSDSTLYKKGSLTVDMFGNAYYQDEDFFVTAHGHVNVLNPKFDMTKNIGLFIATAIKNMFNLKYGFSDMCTQKVLKKEKIYLPVDKNNNPDWTYMDEYMATIQQIAQNNIALLNV